MYFDMEGGNNINAKLKILDTRNPSNISN